MDRLSAPGAVLAFNCGSSSLKFGLFDRRGGDPCLICEGEAEEIGTPEASFWSRAANDGKPSEAKRTIPNFDAALENVRHALDEFQSPPLQAVGHRIVHGGPELLEHAVWTDEIGKSLTRAAEFAPLHLPPALDVLAATQRQYANVPQVLCLDTAFHRTLLDVSRTLPLPSELRRRGVRRYGFHGLSLESVLHELSTVPPRLVVAHLGNGASITAIRNGQSVDTTMALTPNAGILMGTRSGDLDPGVTSYAMRHLQLGVDELENVLNHESGLLGVSETSRDVRDLEKARAADPRADLALRMFVFQVRKAIAGMAVVLGGMDALIFTGGIGEHSETVRREVVDGLQVLGPFETKTLPSEEDLQIARITSRFVAAK